MIDPDTFLTALYVTADDFFQREDGSASSSKPGRPASLSRSEIVTLGLFGQWFGFGGERGYWRWGSQHLRAAFPTLPCRAQFNRRLRAAQDDLARFAVALAERLVASQAAYQALACGQAPDRRTGLRQAPEHLWPAPRASTPPGWLRRATGCPRGLA